MPKFDYLFFETPGTVGVFNFVHPVATLIATTESSLIK